MRRTYDERQTSSSTEMVARSQDAQKRESRIGSTAVLFLRGVQLTVGAADNPPTGKRLENPLQPLRRGGGIPRCHKPQRLAHCSQLE